jgi:flagellar motility protein MotE (MotC chaperone)
MKSGIAGVVVVLGLVAASAGAIASVQPQFSAVTAQTERSDHLQAFADQLMARERELERREAQVRTTERSIRDAEDDLEKRLAHLETLKVELRDGLQVLDEQEETRREGLTKMVESIRARDAAPMFTALADEVALDVLGRMNSQKAGKLLGELPALRAASLAEKLARGTAE